MAYPSQIEDGIYNEAIRNTEDRRFASIVVLG